MSRPLLLKIRYLSQKEKKEKIMKNKLLAMATALLLAAGLAGCGSTDGSGSSESSAKAKDTASSESIEQQDTGDSENAEQQDTENTENTESAEAAEAPEDSEGEAADGGLYDTERLKADITFRMAATISFNDDSETVTDWEFTSTELGDLIQFDMSIDADMINGVLEASGKTIEDIEYINFGVATDCPDDLKSTDTIFYSLSYALKYDIIFEANGGDTRWAYGSDGEFENWYSNTGEYQGICGMPLYVSDLSDIDTFTASYTVDKSDLSVEIFDLSAFLSGDAALEGEGEFGF